MRDTQFSYHLYFLFNNNNNKKKQLEVNKVMVFCTVSRKLYIVAFAEERHKNVCIYVKVISYSY